RLRALPESYLAERQILGGDQDPRMVVSFRKTLAAKSLKQAVDSKKSQWPTVSYLTDVHPVIEWVTDKVLVQLGRHEAPVLHAPIGEPVFLIQGSYSNVKGRPTIVEWMAVTGLPDRPRV